MSQDFLRLNEKGGICYIEPMKKALGTTSAVLSALAISGCAQTQSAAPVIGMANPASVYCAKLGGKTRIEIYANQLVKVAEAKQAKAA